VSSPEAYFTCVGSWVRVERMITGFDMRTQIQRTKRTLVAEQRAWQHQLTANAPDAGALARLRIPIELALLGCLLEALNGRYALRVVLQEPDKRVQRVMVLRARTDPTMGRNAATSRAADCRTATHTRPSWPGGNR